MIAIILDDFKTAKPLISKHWNREILFELRYDKDNDLLQLFDEFDTLQNKAILTYRSTEEGGNGYDDTEKRKPVIRQLNKYRPQYIDLELQRDLELLSEITDSTPIISQHDYSTSMNDAAKAFKNKIDNNFADLHDKVFKFVGKSSDTIDAMKAASELMNIPRHIILSIEPNGYFLRTFRSHFDQEFVFGASDENNNLPYFETLYQSTSSEYLVCGLLGKKLSHSLSPIIHKVLRQQIGIDGDYLLLEVEESTSISYLFEQFSKMSLKGMNVTFPFKSEVITYLDEIDELSKTAQAVNTIAFKDKLIGYNTDISGFTQFIKDQGLDKFQKVLIFGAGGAGRAVGIAFENLGFSVEFINRTRERYKEFSDKLRETTNQNILSDINQDTTDYYYDVDIYVNATTIGYNGSNPVDILRIPDNCEIIIDLNYSNTPLPLENYAEKHNLHYHDGKAMLLYQAVEAFEIWTNKKIDRKKAYQSFMEKYHE